jgi:hypothetical protein
MTPKTKRHTLNAQTQTPPIEAINCNDKANTTALIMFMNFRGVTEKNVTCISHVASEITLLIRALTEIAIITAITNSTLYLLQ